jgi:hypothetical protein
MGDVPTPTAFDTRALTRRINHETKPPVVKNYQQDRGQDLHPRHKAYLDHYCEHYDAKAAALAVGFSPSYAREAGRSILSRKDVWAEFKRRERATLLELGVTPSRMMRLVAGAAMTSPTEIMRWDHSELVLKSSDELSEEALAAVKSIEMTESYTKSGEPMRKVKVTLYDRMRAAELLSKLMSLHVHDPDEEHKDSKKRVFRIGDQVVEFE